MKKFKIKIVIHNGIRLVRFIIPGLTLNSVLFWIPAGVYPVLDIGRE
jgi:hypothetical protein